MHDFTYLNMGGGGWEVFFRYTHSQCGGWWSESFPADGMVSDSMLQQLCSRNLDACESCHLAIISSLLISTFQMALMGRNALHPALPLGHFIGNAAHIKFSSFSKASNQTGHQEARSPGHYLWLEKRGNSAQNHMEKKQFLQTEGRIYDSVLCMFMYFMGTQNEVFTNESI